MEQDSFSDARIDPPLNPLPYDKGGERPYS